MFSFLASNKGTMVGPRFALLLSFALAGGAVVVPAPAPAQCRLCAVPTTERQDADDGLAPLELSVEANLEFDRLLLTRQGAASARLAADGSRTVTGALDDLGGRAMVARIRIHGAPGRPVVLTLPTTIELHGMKGGTLLIDSLSSDAPRDPRLDSSGQLEIRVGGMIHLDGNADGDYRGDLPIAVDYL